MNTKAFWDLCPEYHNVISYELFDSLMKKGYQCKIDELEAEKENTPEPYIADQIEELLIGKFAEIVKQDPENNCLLLAGFINNDPIVSYLGTLELLSEALAEQMVKQPNITKIVSVATQAFHMHLMDQQK